MTDHPLTTQRLEEYARHLRLEEKSAATVEKYLRDTGAFARWLNGRAITKERTAEWKGRLVEQGYAPASINARLSALNSLLGFLGLPACRVRFLKVQRRLFRDADRELTKEEYRRLLAETIGATGIRVSEVRYITVEAARQGRAEIALKGKSG